MCTFSPIGAIGSIGNLPIAKLPPAFANTARGTLGLRKETQASRQPLFSEIHRNCCDRQLAPTWG